MSKQDKSISERHTRTLRDLVKRPENKVCADCKRNDPRWASWNLGVFLCIRCSGIHRGMGTHISKVKSVDLDVWTPDQMRSIQLWGNARANLYWEAHLKPGHTPAEYKMESFIRSKYESRRWALEGPPPADPSILEGNQESDSEPAPPPPVQRQQPLRKPSDTGQSAQRQSHTPLSTQALPKSSAAPHTRPIAPPASIVPTQPSVTSTQDDFFTLDFHSPSATLLAASPSSSAAGGLKDVKNDILSLFAASPPRGTGVLGGGSAGVVAAQPQVQTQPTSMMGSTGTGMWGPQSGWAGTQTGQATHAQTQIWGQPSQLQQQQHEQFGVFRSNPAPQNTGLFASQNVWDGGGPSSTTPSSGVDLFSAPFSSAAATHPVKKDDAFGDLWGSFK